MQRLRFVLNLAYMTGMRLVELANARLEWLRREQLDDSEWAWSIMVLGRRNNSPAVLLPDAR